MGYRNPVNSKSGHVATYSAGDNRALGEIANIGPSAYSGFVSLNQAISSSKPKKYFLMTPGYIVPTVEVRP